MIHVDLDKILSDTDVISQIKDLIAEVEDRKELFVITKKGQPAAALISISYLEELGGDSVKTEVTPPSSINPEEAIAPVADSQEVTSAPLIEEVETPATLASPLPLQTPPAPTSPPSLSVPPIQPKYEPDVNETNLPDLKPSIPPVSPTTSPTPQPYSNNPNPTSLN